MAEKISSLKSLIENPYLIGGILATGGAYLGKAGNVLSKVGNLFHKSITVYSDQPEWDSVNSWYNKTKTRTKYFSLVGGTDKPLTIANGYGSGYLFLGNKFVKLTKVMYNKEGQGDTIKYYIEMDFYFFTKEGIKEFVESINLTLNLEPSILIQSEYSFLKAVPKSFDSIILKEGQKEALIKDIDSFINSRERYKKLGRIHKRVYLLYGPPGTGKSSIGRALATYLDRTLYCAGDNSLRRSLEYWSDDNGYKKNLILIYEDIDKLNFGGLGKESISGLLNELDGLGSKDNTIYILTTNHPENLEPSLLREGRIDYRIELTYLDEYQFKALTKFLREDLTEEQIASLYKAVAKEISPASLQNFLFVNQDSTFDELMVKIKEYEFDVLFHKAKAKKRVKKDAALEKAKKK